MWGRSLCSRGGGAAVAPAPARRRQPCGALPPARRPRSTRAGAAPDDAQPQQPQQEQQQEQEQPPQPPTPDGVRAALEAAVAAEDYAEAARLKAQLEGLQAGDPLLALGRQLQAAVDEERYQDAARLRDQLRELQGSLAPPPPLAGAVPPTVSDTVTRGIRVRVESTYVPSQSVPANSMYFFAYSVAISNEGPHVVMLKSRHWVITDGDGRVDHVRGPGVVGEQPVLKPGARFQYESACPLRTPAGCMEGAYQMVVLDEASGEWGESIEVAIGAFGLDRDAAR